jgi:hypothetical protein
MLNFLIGVACGAVLAVVSPPFFRFVAAKVAKAKAQIAAEAGD